MSKNYFRELELYDKSEILDCLENDKNAFNKLIRNKIISKNGSNYNFHYVGSIILGEHAINVYPKYIENKDNIKTDFKQILKIFNKYNKLHEDFDNQEEDFEDVSLYMLPLMIFFIEDFYDNGVYHKVKNILQINGMGEINWNRTINESSPIIKDNKPYYAELQTNYKLDNLFDYFRLLHEFILTECSRILEKAGLLQMLDLTPVELSDNALEDFGSIDYILNRIKMQLNVEFNTHKQKLLKSMYDYLYKWNSFSNEELLLLFGTIDYEYVWEDICSVVFDNKLDDSLYDLNLGRDKNTTLRTFIDKPKWFLDENCYEKRTLRPDLITIFENNFIICDAKYYNFIIEDGELKKQPELESITKQYLYELAFKGIICSNRLNVINAFLFPAECDDFEKRGHVELNIWFDLELQPIDVIMLPAKIVNQCYLENETIPIKELLDIIFSN